MTHRFTGIILCGIPIGLATGKATIMYKLMFFFLQFCLLIRHFLFHSGYPTSRILSILFGNVRRHGSKQVYYHVRKISRSLAIFISFPEWNPAPYLGCWIFINNEGGGSIWLHCYVACGCFSVSSHIFIILESLESLAFL